MGTIPVPNTRWTLAAPNGGMPVTFLVNIWTSEVLEQITFQSLFSACTAWDEGAERLLIIASWLT